MITRGNDTDVCPTLGSQTLNDDVTSGRSTSNPNPSLVSAAVAAFIWAALVLPSGVQAQTPGAHPAPPHSRSLPSNSSPAVKVFIAHNKFLLQSTPQDAKELLVAFYAAEVALKLCNRKSGTFLTEMQEATRRRILFEQVLQQVFAMPVSYFVANRKALGVDTATGQFADALSANPYGLQRTCDEGLASTSAFLNFTQ